MHDHVQVDEDSRHWSVFRPRRHVKARRIGHVFDFAGRIYPDGYVVRGVDGRVVVLTVAEFEAIYEPAARGE